MRIVCQQTILMKYHALFIVFEKAAKFEIFVCCKSRWRFKFTILFSGTMTHIILWIQQAGTFNNSEATESSFNHKRVNCYLSRPHFQICT